MATLFHICTYNCPLFRKSSIERPNNQFLDGMVGRHGVLRINPPLPAGLLWLLGAHAQATQTQFYTRFPSGWVSTNKFSNWFTLNYIYIIIVFTVKKPGSRPSWTSRTWSLCGSPTGSAYSPMCNRFTDASRTSRKSHIFINPKRNQNNNIGKSVPNMPVFINWLFSLIGKRKTLSLKYTTHINHIYTQKHTFTHFYLSLVHINYR